jgi:hypothetical protein
MGRASPYVLIATIGDGRCSCVTLHRVPRWKQDALALFSGPWPATPLSWTRLRPVFQVP